MTTQQQQQQHNPLSMQSIDFPEKSEIPPLINHRRLLYRRINWQWLPGFGLLILFDVVYRQLKRSMTSDMLSVPTEPPVLLRLAHFFSIRTGEWPHWLDLYHHSDNGITMMAQSFCKRTPSKRTCTPLLPIPEPIHTPFDISLFKRMQLEKIDSLYVQAY